jgi:pimeloyl-ACP methyl ester carboxylesterase
VSAQTWSLMILKRIKNIFTCSFRRRSNPSRPSKSSIFASSDLSPISPATYFSQALQVNPEGYPCAFRAYYTPSTLSTAPQSTNGGKKASLLVCHHGAGSSGTTFSALAKEVQGKSKGELGVLTFDARGHGKIFQMAYPVYERVILNWGYVHQARQPPKTGQRN